MAREFKETAHLKTDLKKYQDQYDHIFNKAKCHCEACETLRVPQNSDTSRDQTEELNPRMIEKSGSYNS